MGIENKCGQEKGRQVAGEMERDGAVKDGEAMDQIHARKIKAQVKDAKKVKQEKEEQAPRVRRSIARIQQ